MRLLQNNGLLYSISHCEKITLRSSHQIMPDSSKHKYKKLIKDREKYSPSECGFDPKRNKKFALRGTIENWRNSCYHSFVHTTCVHLINLVKAQGNVITMCINQFTKRHMCFLLIGSAAGKNEPIMDAGRIFGECRRGHEENRSYNLGGYGTKDMKDGLHLSSRHWSYRNVMT